MCFSDNNSFINEDNHVFRASSEIANFSHQISSVEFPDKNSDEYFMELAIEAAKQAYNESEIPIGCVLVKSGEIISTAFNKREQKQNVLAHAELLAIDSACKSINSWRLDGVDCYVTLEPCHMCVSALQQARIRRLIYGAKSPKTGAIVSIDRFFENSNLNHFPAITSGILENEASSILQNFFRNRRNENKALDKSLGGRSKRVKLRTESESDYNSK